MPTKLFISQHISNEMGISLREAGRITDLIINEIIEQGFHQSKQVYFKSFGVFYTKKKRARKVRHIRENRELIFPACEKLSFRLSDTFKKKVTNNVNEVGLSYAFNQALKKKGSKPA